MVPGSVPGVSVQEAADAIPQPRRRSSASSARRLGRALVSLLRFLLHSLQYGVGVVLGAALVYEVQTSALQAR